MGRSKLKPEPAAVFRPPSRTSQKRLRTSPIKKVWIIFKHVVTWSFFALLLLQGWFFAHIVWWDFNAPPSTAFMRQRAEENPGLRIRYSWVPYSQISPHLKRALIAAEDAHF